MRSLHVVTSDARRGAETFAVHLVEGLRALGHDADIVAMTASGSPEAHALQVLGTHRRSVGSFGSLRTLARRADVVVAHGSSTLEMCALGLAGTGVPFVYRTIGDPNYWVTTKVRQAWVGLLLRSATRHVALWPGAADQLTLRYRVAREHIDVIPNAVADGAFPFADDARREEARQQLDVDDRVRCLLYVGALSEEKNVRLAIETVARLAETVLVVAGDGPDRDGLEDLAGRLAPGRVRWLGPVRDPASLYAAADALVLPSRSEGMPGVLIEAISSGTPVVATAVGAVPNLLEGIDSAHIVPEGDDSSFVQATGQAVTSGRRLTRASAGDFAARFSISAVAERWLVTLHEAALSPGGR